MREIGYGLIPLGQWRRLLVGLVARRNTILMLDAAPCGYMALVHVTDRIDRRLTPQPDRILWATAPNATPCSDWRTCGSPISTGRPKPNSARPPRPACTSPAPAGAAGWLVETMGGVRGWTGCAAGGAGGGLPSRKRLEGGCWEWSASDLLARAGGA